MTKGYVKCESYIVLSSGLEIDIRNYNRFKYRKEVLAEEEIREFNQENEDEYKMPLLR